MHGILFKLKNCTGDFSFALQSTNIFSAEITYLPRFGIKSQIEQFTNFVDYKIKNFHLTEMNYLELHKQNTRNFVDY